jgi:hypothetical protein
MTREVTANKDEGPRQEWATPRLIADVLVAEFRLDPSATTTWAAFVVGAERPACSWRTE